MIDQLNLHEACRLIGIQLGIDGEQVYQYAIEDREGGYSANAAESTWPMGSLWKPEGQILYALIRYFDVKAAVEIGAFHGCSAAHIAAALDVTGGTLHSIDLAHQRVNTNPRVKQVTADGTAWLSKQPDNSLDLIFEDADHSTEMSAAIAKLAMKKLKPGGLHLAHDAAHNRAIIGGGQVIPSDVGRAICAGLVQAFGNKFRVYLIEPSDCGFSLWQRPGDVQAIAEMFDAQFEAAAPALLEAVKKAKKPARKRTAKKG